MQSKEHWEKVYASKAPTEVSWFQQHAELSLRLVRETGISLNASIIDVGGGASTFVDDLLRSGYQNVTVLDISGAALTAAKVRLGSSRSARVHWLETGVLDAELPARAYDLWHDRAVFHFLVTPEARRAYIQTVLKSVKPGGLVIVATFAEDGPTTCSGLPVMRYSVNGLREELGDLFVLIKHEREAHRTPAGKIQPFIYCVFRKAVLG
jgi:2-polyprenyl-3-methyl-5-hydroxy-6-metoxy-1,4-benzoquinol methylase